MRRLVGRSWSRVYARLLTSVVGCQTSEKKVAITFDDGPNPTYTPAILDVLASYNVKATFFLLGEHVVANPGLARAIVAGGHAVGNHTFTHKSLKGCGAAGIFRELLRCHSAIARATGVRPRVMRPPYGSQGISSGLVSMLFGYSPVHWSVSGDDWRGDPAPLVVERVLADTKPGAIILLHDGSETKTGRHPPSQDRWPTVNALPLIIEELQNRGYGFETLTEMLRTRPLVKRIWS